MTRAHTPDPGAAGQQASFIESGQSVQYSATPVYDGSGLVPRGITLQGQGSGGFRLGVAVLNPVRK